MGRVELHVLYAATRAAILFLVPPFISDLPVYEIYARNLVPGGKVPYLDWALEYPPLAYLLTSAPVWLHDLLGLQGTESHRLLFGLFLLPFDLALYRGLLRAPSFRGAPFLYLLLTSCLALLLFDRFDLAVGFLLAWPFLGGGLPSDRRLALSFGLGGALKLVPLVLAPLPALGWPGAWKKREWWERGARFAVLALAPLAVSCALAAWLGKGKVSFFSHHAQRGVQIESLVGSVFMFRQSYFPGEVRIENNFGAQHLGGIPDIIVAISHGLLPLVLALTYGGLWLGRQRYRLLGASWLVISGFVTFGYVLSPQFLLWLVPIGALAAGEVPPGFRRAAWLAAFGGAVALTGAHFRYYWSYVNFSHLSTLLLLGRNALLLLTWAMSWAWMGGRCPGLFPLAGGFAPLLSSAHDPEGSPAAGPGRPSDSGGRA